ncbi:MAG: stage III sporulation protein AF [Clostridia bacterium]|nr:stage III sporulation protein AF [Clostridia bacterium]
MSTVSIWVLSVVGIIILSMLVDLILPSGSMSKFIKSIFGYLIIVVILSPVFSFFTQKNFSINDIFSSSSVQIQDSFVVNVNRQFLDSIEQSIEKTCYDRGIKFVEVGIEADIFENEIEVKQISVNLKNIVITDQNKHTNIRTSIIAVIKENIKIQEEIIKFYE